MMSLTKALITRLNQLKKLQKANDKLSGGREPEMLMHDISGLIYRKLKAETDGGMWHYFVVRLALIPSPSNPNKKVQTFTSEGEF
jgi:hypothetical protein